LVSLVLILAVTAAGCFKLPFGKLVPTPPDESAVVEEPSDGDNGESTEQPDAEAPETPDPGTSTDGSSDLTIVPYCPLNDNVISTGLCYEFYYTHADGSKKEGKVWIQGSLYRMDLTTPGAAKEYFLCDANGYQLHWVEGDTKAINEGVAMETTPGECTDFFWSNAPLTGHEVIDGQNCAVFTVKIPDVDIDETLWVTEDYGLTVRYENRASGNLELKEFKNVQVGPIPADIFTLPSGMEEVS
jgi:hypothetical protein